MLEQDPDNALLLADAAELALSGGLLELAERYTQRALDVDTSSPTARFRMASIRLAQRRLNDARNILDALWNEGRQHPAILHNRAYARFLAPDMAACEAVLRDAMTSPGPAQSDASLQVLWLRALHNQERLEDAWAWASPLVASGKLQGTACAVASLIAVDLGLFSQAKELSEAAIQANPSLPEALVARASVALSEQAPGLARELAERAFRINSADGRACMTLGFVDLLEGKGEAAMHRFEAAVAALPGHAMAWQGLGWACVVAGALQKAKQAFLKAREIDPTDADGAGGVALVLALQKDAAGARPYLQEAQQLDPENAAAHYAQAVLSGDVDALKNAEQVVRSWFGVQGPG